MGERAVRVVMEVVRFEPIGAAEHGSRRAVVRWSDGTIGEAARWYDDEIMLCEGDLVGKTADAIQRLIFRRDRQYLHNPDVRETGAR